MAPGGSIVKTYPFNATGIYCLALGADNNSFWTCEHDSGEIWQVDIATGRILEDWFDGAFLSTGGLAIFPATPLPSKCARPCKP